MELSSMCKFMFEIPSVPKFDTVRQNTTKVQEYKALVTLVLQNHPIQFPYPAENYSTSEKLSSRKR